MASKKSSPAKRVRAAKPKDTALSAAESAAPFVPGTTSLSKLREAARSCRGCGLYAHATQTVFGEGPRSARVMFVGEQPGDKEDVAGRPFVGPAGRILERGLDAAGIPRELSYVTNAVKHFSFEERGKVRLHKRPKPGEIRACRPWLVAELSAIEPAVIVVLGATAAQALLGPAVRVTKDRGRPLPNELGAAVFATVHPSSILRAPDDAAREAAFAAFVDDLRAVARALEQRDATQQQR